MAGDQRWWIHDLASEVWLDEEQRGGIDVKTVTKQILSAAVNGQSLAEFIGSVGDRTVDAILQQQQSQGMLDYHRLANGEGFIVASVSPLARRRLRQN